jgi:hypothetical protein
LPIPDAAELSDLIAACKEGRLYDVERWIAAGRPLQLDPAIDARIRRKPTAMSLSIASGTLDLTRLLLCNGYRPDLEIRSPLDTALERLWWDLLHLRFFPPGPESRRAAPFQPGAGSGSVDRTQRSSADHASDGEEERGTAFALY